MAKRSVSKPASVSKPTAAKSNAVDFAVLYEDVQQSLSAIRDNATDSTKRNQRIAWDILRYRDTLSAPLAWSKLAGGGKALTEWRGVIRELFIGKAPPMKGDKTGDMFNAQKAYKARQRIIDDAATFCVAAGNAGVTLDNFSETLNCFSVPASVLFGADCTPEYELRDEIEAGRLIPLNNLTWQVSTKNKEGKRATRTIHASLAQVLSVFSEKTKPVPAIAAHTAAIDAVKGRSEVGTIAEPVIKAVLKNAGIEKLAFAMRDAMNADPNLVIRRSDFEQDVWTALMSIAQRILSIDSVGDMLANKSKAA